MVIRPVEGYDSSWIVFQRNRPIIRQYFRQPFFLTEREQGEWFKEKVVTKQVFAFVGEVFGKRVGYVSLSNIDKIARRAEFSIFVTPEEWGKGYGGILVQHILHYAFSELNLNQVYSDVFETNPAINWYIYQLGFHLNGTLRDWYFKGGEYIDSFHISITREEYDELHHN